MNDKLQHIPNKNSNISSDFKALASSPNLVPALNSVLKIFSLCVDVHISEKERRKAEIDLIKTLKKFDLFDKKLDHQIKQEQDYIRFLMRVTEKLLDQGQFEVASDFNDKMYSIVNGSGNRIVETFNQHSTDGNIILVNKENP